MKKAFLVMLIVVTLIGCATTKTMPDGTVTKVEIDKSLFAAALQAGPQLLPLLQAYGNAYLEYKNAEATQASARKQKDLLDKLSVAKDVLQTGIQVYKDVKGTP